MSNKKLKNNLLGGQFRPEIVYNFFDLSEHFVIDFHVLRSLVCLAATRIAMKRPGVMLGLFIFIGAGSAMDRKR